jgi:DNA polymerase-3 subunit delta'
LAGEPLRKAAQASLAAADSNAPEDGQWDQLERLAEGSVRRALQLVAGGGLDLHARVESLFSELPKVDWPAVHVLADSLSLGAQEQRYEAFFSFLLDKVARLARLRATGASGLGEPGLARHLISERRLPEWAALWGALLRDKAACEELNLDRKALILRALARLQAVSQT